jgi:hypothetical protein
LNTKLKNSRPRKCWCARAKKLGKQKQMARECVK